MKYKKLPIIGYNVLNMYPVYVENDFMEKIPSKIVGIRQDSIEIQNEIETLWVPNHIVFVISTVCEEQLKPKGCQVHNVNCCGGGSVIKEHVAYWENLIN